MSSTDTDNDGPPELSQWFWEIVDRAQKSRDQLREILMQLTSEELGRFQDEFEEAAVALTEEPIVDYTDRELTEDGMEDLTMWVVSQGSAFYYSVWEDPARMPATIPEGRLKENLAWIPYGVHAKKFDTDLELPPHDWDSPKKGS